VLSQMSIVRYAEHYAPQLIDNYSILRLSYRKFVSITLMLLARDPMCLGATGLKNTLWVKVFATASCVFSSLDLIFG
jgi:membrane protein YqaA with SNARE-associated domain